MIKKILQAIQRWRYLGYDRNIVQRYRAQTDRTNLQTLKRLCILTMAVFDILAIFYSMVMRETNSIIAVVLCTGFVLFLYAYTSNLLRSVSAGPIRGANSLIYLISAALYLSGIVSGTILCSDELGVLPIWMFLLVQISFDLPPLQNVLTVLPFAGLYLVVSAMTKSPKHIQYDALYTLLSVSVGLFISYHQAHLALENIIAKSNLQKANFALYHTATTDALTGLMNRRMLFDRCDQLSAACLENGQSLACAVLDIDDYKQFNDTYGHPEGDELLRMIGAAYREYGEKKQIDIGRIGGEEFLAVWPEDSATRCEAVAEDLRLAVERMNIPHKSATDHERVTMSVGFCLLPPKMVQNAYFYADKALYRAKDAGKNCCCCYDPEGGTYRFICASKSDKGGKA